MSGPTRDIYGRPATSKSRGKTIDRIMQLQHATGMIPGTEGLLDGEQPTGSIAAAITSFHRGWVEPKPVTTRRAYERSLAFFARDLAANAPALDAPFDSIDRDRLVGHLDWRIRCGLDDPGELQRAALHLTRLCEWSNEQLGSTIEVDREWMRERAAERIATGPLPFHVAKTADDLRDTSADARVLGEQQ